MTHLKRLKDPALLLICSSRASSTSDHLGPVLIQLPPGWKLNVQRLPEFLEFLPKKVHFAIEFRDLTWYSHPVYWLLGRRNVVLSIHNWPNENWPQRLTAFAYLRFHGVNGPYLGSYPDRTLTRWAGRIEAFLRAELDQFAPPRSRSLMGCL